ncbi:hypothetical protein [uncultured Microbacterium sp.]|uniref:hypothetical protein n=1 Tax=uncultured Microbacterium sp. TaxID=191216 RepID=UPI0026278A85|nr:hypothetical protein [uncultured Microbacterium sp.]
MTSPGREATGVSAWALGLLILIPVPMLGALASGGAMIAAYGTLSKQGELAKVNAAAARRWGLTFLVVSTGLLVAQLVIGIVRLITHATGAPGFLPLGIPIGLYFLVCVVHVMVVVVGTMRARRGEVVRLPFMRDAA